MKKFTYPSEFPKFLRVPFEKYVHETYNGSGVEWSNPTVSEWKFHSADSAKYGMGYEIFWTLSWDGEYNGNYSCTFLAQFGLLDVYWEACGLECPTMTGGKCKKDSGAWCTGPKFSSTAAEILWLWSLETAQDEESGCSEFGNGWHALFRDERAILHTNSQGFVSAWRVEDSDGIDTVWEGIEAGAVYPDDLEGDDE